MDDEWDFGSDSPASPPPRGPGRRPPATDDGGGDDSGRDPGDLYSVAPGHDGESVGAPLVVRPPLHWLVIALVVAVLGLAAAATASLTPSRAWVGWVLGGFVASGLLALFTLQDARKRADPWYASSAAAAPLRAAVMLASLAAVALSAWQYADWAAR